MALFIQSLKVHGTHPLSLHGKQEREQHTSNFLLLCFTQESHQFCWEK